MKGGVLAGLEHIGDDESMCPLINGSGVGDVNARIVISTWAIEKRRTRDGNRVMVLLGLLLQGRGLDFVTKIEKSSDALRIGSIAVFVANH